MNNEFDKMWQYAAWVNLMYRPSTFVVKLRKTTTRLKLAFCGSIFETGTSRLRRMVPVTHLCRVLCEVKCEALPSRIRGITRVHSPAEAGVAQST